MPAAGPRAPRLVLLITEDWYFWSHRKGLAEAAIQAGFEVHLATRVADHGEAIRACGVHLHDIGLRRMGRNPWREARAVGELAALYRRIAPDVVHHVGVKPMIYGSLAARLAGVRAVVNAQAGLGYVFTARGAKAGFIRAIVSAAYRSAWGGAGTRVIFQNPDNLEYFVTRGLLPRSHAVLVRGVGVDPDLFRIRPEPPGVPVVMLAGRMLWDKGIGEAVEATRRLRARGLALRLVLVGRTDRANPKAIPESTLRAWDADGVAEWWGARTDMPEVLAGATVVILPSYMEGLPRVLVEAAAVGRAIVTTDVPGCRDVVRHGESGLLVPLRDAGALADAVAGLLADPAARARMGRAGRALVESRFTEAQSARRTIEVYRGLVGRAGV